MKRNICFGFLFFCILTVLCACSAVENKEDNLLVGYWINTEGVSLSFTENNQVRYAKDIGTYSIYDKSKVLVTIRTPTDYGFVVDNGVLSLTNLESSTVTKFYGEDHPIFTKVNEKVKLENEIEVLEISVALKEVEQDLIAEKRRVEEENGYGAIIDGQVVYDYDKIYSLICEQYGGEENYIKHLTLKKCIENNPTITSETAEQLYSDYKQAVEKLNVLINELDEY